MRPLRVYISDIHRDQPMKSFVILHPRLLTLLWLLFVASAQAAPDSDLWSFWEEAGAKAERIDHSAWQKVLDRYLITDHDSGVNRFDYAAVSGADVKMLYDYLQALQAVDPREYPRAEQFAYWVNFYNAATVKLVLDAYPVESIRKVRGGWFSRGPWNEDIATVAGQSITLNDIEHRILRPIWNEPRIHFVVNCASIGCPNLAPQAFTARNAEQLLQQSARDYLSHPRGARFEDDRLTLSSIFDWYQVDFGDSEQAMLRTISGWMPVAQAQRVRNYDGRIDYEYDWRLNER